MKRLRIDELKGGDSAQYQVAKILGPALRLELGRVRSSLSSLPLVLPIQLEPTEAEVFAEKLRDAGAQVSVIEMPAGTPPRCVHHPMFISSALCGGCSAELCLICEREGAGMCPSCLGQRRRKKRNQSIRLGVLLMVLGAVGLVGWKELRRRSVDWTSTQRVAVILLSGEDGGLRPEVAEDFRLRAREVEDALGQLARGYGVRSDAVKFEVFGPVRELESPPDDLGEGPLELLKFNLALSNYADVHDDALHLDSGAFDVRIYVRARASEGTREMVEGIGQELGQIGLMNVELSREGIDFAWFVVVHEFFHTRGASDKYDARGLSRVPEGLADPEAQPRYPQLGTEVMARGRPLSATQEETPGPPETWSVGAWTAREIKWAP